FEWHSSDSTSGKLTYSSKLLSESWKKFSPIFDSDCMKCIAGDSIPTVDVLLSAVNDTNTVRESNKQAPMGQVRERFLNFTNKLNDYSFLFSIIPNNEKYTILITGVVSSIAKAAAKYQDTAERISLALERIAYDIGNVKKRTTIADTLQAHTLVIEFFVGIFELLCLIMSWYKSRAKRLLGSFNKSFDKDLKEKIDAVQKTLKDLSDETRAVTEIRVQDMHEGVAAINSKMVSVDKELKDVKVVLNQLAKELGPLANLGFVATRQLNYVQHDYVRQSAVATKRLPGLPVSRYTPYPLYTMDKTNNLPSTPINDHLASDFVTSDMPKSDVLRYADRLQPYVDDGLDLISRDGRPTARSILPNEVVREMQNWMASVQSQILWVEGPSLHGSEPLLSMAALHTSSVAKNASIPCISYFCTPSTARRRAVQSDQRLNHTEATCVSLLYSVIIQLCKYLPYDHIETTEFVRQLRRLDGSLQSLEIAIDVIQHLFTTLPPFTVWVLDRLPFGGARSTVPYMKRFIDILRFEHEHRVTKVLFTTEGNTPWLASNVGARERFVASRMALNRPGQQMPGAVSPLFNGNFYRGR
ncbi:hypothetical protein F4808DRAFT_469814, partial [Astrocystis sublimbata]